MAKGKVKIVPASLVMLVFLTAILGVMVTGLAPLIRVAGTVDEASFPKVLRSATWVFTLPPRAVGGMVGIVGDNWGKDITC